MSKWNSFFKIVERIVPVALQAIPGAAIIEPLVTNAIHTTEEFHDDKTSEQKLDTAVKIFFAGATAVNAKRPGTIPTDVIAQVAQHGITAIVDAANLAHLGVQAQDGVGVQGGATAQQLGDIAAAHSAPVAAATPMTVPGMSVLPDNPRPAVIPAVPFVAPAPVPAAVSAPAGASPAIDPFR